MSKIKIVGHASGTGVLTIAAPNTNTDRTITIPDSTATIATTADVAARLPSITDNGNATAITIDSSENITVSGNVTASAGSVLLNADNFLQFSNDSFARLVVNDTEIFRAVSDGRGLSEFTVRAWCNFSGSGTPSFWGSAQHNVSSISDIGTGNYNVNFTNAMANTNYCAIGTGQGGLNVNPDGWATTYVKLNLRVEATNASADGGHVGVAVFTEA